MRKTLAIIGAGHVGAVLGRLFAHSGAVTLQDVLTRSPASAQAGVTFIGAGCAVDRLAALRPAQVYMLAVPDHQIAPVCAALAADRALDGALVFHCSGARTSAELGSAARRGALTASVHPIRSFADPATVAAGFSGTFCGIEGEPEASAWLVGVLTVLGARPIAIDAGAKTLYHAASVFASNYLVTVLDAALRAYEVGGIAPDVARALAAPLAAESMANVFRLGPARALSGPIARGDEATVARQQAALDAWDGPTGQLYRALTLPTRELARRQALADPSADLLHSCQQSGT